MVGVLVIVATNVEARVRRVEVPVIARWTAGCIGTAQVAPRWPPPNGGGFVRGLTPPHTPPSREFLEAAADVRAGARHAAVVDVEQAVVGALVTVATNVEARVRRVEAPAIARVRRFTAARGGRNERRECTGHTLHAERRRPAAGRRTNRNPVGTVAETVGVLQSSGTAYRGRK